MGLPPKVAVDWTEDAPVLIEQALRERFVTGLRIAPVGQNHPEQDFDEEDESGEPAEPEPVEGVGALATLNLGRLAELDLSYLTLGTFGAEALAVSAFFRACEAQTLTCGLRVLDLRYCRIGDSGLAALAASPGFGTLRRLHLQRNKLTAEGMRVLHRFEHLTDLDLRYNAIGAEGVEALLEAPFIGSLTRLLLYRKDVSDDGVKLLARAPQLRPALRSYWRSV